MASRILLELKKKWHIRDILKSGVPFETKTITYGWIFYLQFKKIYTYLTSVNVIHTKCYSLVHDLIGNVVGRIKFCERWQKSCTGYINLIQKYEFAS